MTRRSLVLTCAIAPFLRAGQGGQERKSPHETVSLDLGGRKVQITYGRPYLKGRTAFTGDLAPNGQVWRLGADEATKMTLTAAARLNQSLAVPAGSYALFAIPGAHDWTIIVNKTADQWGAFSYKQDQDLGRFQVPVKTGSKTEEFTIALQKSSADTAMVSLMWQDSTISFPLQFS